jgi:RNA polymerase sigma-70 factor (ECF subfamily)
VGAEITASDDADREITRRLVPPDQWEAIVKKWDHRVVVSLIAMGLRVERARELAQTTWMRLLEQHRGGKLEKLDFPGIALAQARFLGLDELRRSRKESARFSSLEIESPTIPDGSPNAEHRLLSREEIDQALAALATCSASAQKVFRLTHEYPAMPHAEVAEKVGLSVQRVRQILCEVRKKIRLAIERETTHHG